MEKPWPLAAGTDVPTKFLLCRDDRLFPAEFMRRHVHERLGITPDEIDGGHLVALSRPKELAERLDAYVNELQPMTGRGLPAAGLERLHDRMAWHVGDGPDSGADHPRRPAPPWPARRARRRDRHRGVRRRVPMRRDTIFRIASLTKPITAAAAMMLVDDGMLRFDDPVDELLPELADRRVLRRLDGRARRHRARRAADHASRTCSRSGWASALIDGAARHLSDPDGAERNCSSARSARRGRRRRTTPDEWMRRFGTLPLMHQPGERWIYNTGSHVLGVLFERAAGQPLEALLRERLFEPLGHGDTTFTVRPSERGRFTTAYPPDPARPARRSSTGSTTATGRAAGLPQRRRRAGVHHRRLLGVRADAARRRCARPRGSLGGAVGEPP